MSIRMAVVAAASWLAWASIAQAQAVQLPTFRQFSTSTSVLVPDQGAVNLGGVNSSSQGSVSRGFPIRPFGNRAIGSSSGAANMQVSAQIHDFEAMDKALLAEGERLLGQPGGAIVNAGERKDGQVGNLSYGNGQVGNLSYDRPLSLAEIRQRQAQQSKSRELDAAENLLRGQTALAADKPGVAKIYLRIAARHGTGDVREQALALLQKLEPSQRSANSPASLSAK